MRFRVFAKLLAALAITTMLAAQSAPTPSGAAEIILVHGDILTGSHLRSTDHSLTPARVHALAIRSGRIIAVGTDAEVLSLRDPRTRVIDLAGRFVMPGFNDAHTHMGLAGAQGLAIDLNGSKSLREMQQRIQTAAQTAPPGSWLLGGGWDQTFWQRSRLPTRDDLDGVTGDHPAVFRRVDAHLAVANSAALSAAGIGAGTPDPAGARIDRDAEGRPTGVLREAAATALVYRVVPPPTPPQRRRALLAAIADALAHGVTSVQDNSEWEDFLALQSLEHTGELKLRFAEWMDFTLPIPTLEQQRAAQPADDPLLHLTQLKGFLDGSLGSRTAAMLSPYTDDPTNSGLPRYTQQSLSAMADERTAHGFQVGFHAIGDRANAMALDAFAAAESHTAAKSLRLRIEHAQVLDAADLDRFAALGVIASMQPSHLLTDMRWAAQRLGPERLRYAYAWRSLLDREVTLAFGTDYPVESINPLRGLYSAVTRQNTAGTQTFEPQERLSLAQAIYAYTQASAFAEFREQQKGRLEPGFVADLVVLDRDITAVPSAALLHTRVLRTVVNGETVFQATTSSRSAPRQRTAAAQHAACQHK